MTLKILTLSVLVAVLAMPSASEARKRKKKFKTPVVVNQILRLNGTMTVNGEAAHEFGGVKEGDVLETGDKSWSIFRIPGLGIYYLGPQSKVKLTKFGGRDITKFELLKGGLLCIYKRLGSHEVRTDEAVVIPTGNAPANIFWVTEQEKDALVYLWDGKIQIQSRESAVATAKATLTPQIKESDVPVDSKVDPTKNPAPPVAVASPTEEAPQFVHDVTATTKSSWLKYLVSKNEGVKEKGELSVAPPETKTISDMESLYALP